MGCIITTKRKVNGFNQIAVATLSNDTLAVYRGRINYCKQLVEALETVDNPSWSKTDLEVVSTQIIDDDPINNVQGKGNATLTVRYLGSVNIGRTIVINVENFTKDSFKAQYEGIIGSILNLDYVNTNDFVITNAVIEVF